MALLYIEGGSFASLRIQIAQNCNEKKKKKKTKEFKFIEKRKRDS